MVVSALIANACGGDSTAPCTINSVSIEPFAPSLVVGGTLALTATPDASNCTTTPNPTWSSNSDAVATITSAGVVTAVGAGSAIIMAVIGTASDTSVITVTAAPVSTIEVTLASVTMGAGTTQQATATLRAASGQILTGRTVTWSSSATGTALVNATTGVVSGVAGGTAVITATSEGRTGSTTVVVSSIPVNTVTVTTTSATMFTQATLQATAVVRDINNTILTDRTVTWTSSTPAIATVNASTGLITSGSTAGTVTIIGASEGKVGTVNITVSLRPVATVTLTTPSAAMAIGATQQIAAVLTDANSVVLTGRTIVWSTSAGAVASVSQTGLVTGLTSGVTIITATSEGRSATTGVTVVLVPTITSFAPSIISSVFSQATIAMGGTSITTPGAALSYDLTSFFSASSFDATSATTGVMVINLTSASLSGTANFRFVNAGATGNTRSVTIYAAATAPNQTSAAFGGSGGSFFGSRDCAAGSVATGLNGRGGNNIDQLSLRCQSVTGTTRTFGTAASSAAAGGSGGTAFTQFCAANQVMVGISARASSNGTGSLSAVAAVCAPIGGAANVTTAFSGNAVVTGTAAGVVMCPVGLAVTGFEGNAGILVDRISVHCR